MTVEELLARLRKQEVTLWLEGDRLRFKAPPDAYPPDSTAQVFPMHCHAEMSQTAGGGLYPHGIHTKISLGTSPTTESDLQKAVALLP